MPSIAYTIHHNIPPKVLNQAAKTACNLLLVDSDLSKLYNLVEI